MFGPAKPGRICVMSIRSAFMRIEFVNHVGVVVAINFRFFSTRISFHWIGTPMSFNSSQKTEDLMIGKFLELAIYHAIDCLGGKTSLLGVNWEVKTSSITWITGGI